MRREVEPERRRLRCAATSTSSSGATSITTVLSATGPGRLDAHGAVLQKDALARDWAGSNQESVSTSEGAQKTNRVHIRSRPNPVNPDLMVSDFVNLRESDKTDPIASNGVFLETTTSYSTRSRTTRHIWWFQQL